MSFFKGTYVFKQNGIEIGRSNNLITSNGRKMILEYLSGSRTEWASDMAIGAMPTNVAGGSPQVTDTQLNFETSRQPVTLKSFISATNTDPDLIVVRSMMPADLVANIYEVGLYAIKNSNFSTSTRNNIILTDFSNLTQWYTSAGSVSTHSFIPQGSGSPRIGSNSIVLNSGTTYRNDNLNIDFTNYTNQDSLQLLVSESVSGNVTVILKDISGNQQEINFATSNNSSYAVISNLFDQTTSGSNYTSISNFSVITGIEIITDSSASLIVDAIKVSSANEISTEESLVSKSVLTNPIAKLPNVPLDVEYYIELL